MDRWPEPRAVVIVAPTDMVLAGDPSALRPADLRALAFKGMIEAPPEFVPLLEATYSDLRPWPRIVGTLEGGSPPPVPAGVVVRRLVAGDETLARTLHKSGSWVWKHYRDTDAMVASGQAWAAIAEGKCVSVAAPFTRGDLYEDIATFTDPDFRGMGLSTACKGRLIEDVKSRGHVTSVGNGRTNLAVHRVNARLGYRKHRDDVLYVTGIKTP